MDTERFWTYEKDRPQERDLRGGMEVSYPPTQTLKIPFRNAKTVVQCISAGQFTGPKTIAELLLLRKRLQT